MTDVYFRHGVYAVSRPQTINLVGPQSVPMSRDPPQEFARLELLTTRLGGVKLAATLSLCGWKDENR